MRTRVLAGGPLMEPEMWTEEERLVRCQDALRRMEAEIVLLRDASLTFGELADRLNDQLRVLRAQLSGSGAADA